MNQDSEHMERGKQISTERSLLAEAELALHRAEQDLENAVRAIKSEWARSGRYKEAGSNNNERDAVMGEAIHEQTAALRDAVLQAKESVERTRARFEGLCDVRRGAEWDTRSGLSNALRAGFVTTNHRNFSGHGSNFNPNSAAFDDAVDKAVEERLQERIQPMVDTMWKQFGPWEGPPYPSHHSSGPEVQQAQETTRQIAEAFAGAPAQSRAQAQTPPPPPPPPVKGGKHGHVPAGALFGDRDEVHLGEPSETPVFPLLEVAGSGPDLPGPDFDPDSLPWG